MGHDTTSVWLHGLRGSIVGGAIYICAALLNVLVQLILTRNLGIEGYGVFVYVYSLILLLAVPATLGFQMGLLRFVPAYIATADWGALKGVVRFGLGATACVGLVLAFLGWAGLTVVETRLSPDLFATFVVGFALLPGLALVRSGVSVVRGLDRLARRFWPT